jgi:hypothetical protein
MHFDTHLSYKFTYYQNKFFECHSQRFCGASERWGLQIMFFVMGPLAILNDPGGTLTSERRSLHTAAANQEKYYLYHNTQI